MREYNKITTKLRKIYKGIEKYCNNCDNCCFTYGWIMPLEEKYYKSVYDLIELNQGIYCFDSFERDSNGKRILDIIPRCAFYENQSCSIHSNKPFDCLLYPVKVLFSKKENMFTVVLSLDCPYVESLVQEERGRLMDKVNSFFSEIPEDILWEYLKMVKLWSSISKNKSFKHIVLKKISGAPLHCVNEDENKKTVLKNNN